MFSRRPSVQVNWSSGSTSIQPHEARQLIIFAAADNAIGRPLPTKLADPSIRSIHIKGQEKSAEPPNVDRELARKKRVVKKRGANNKKKRTNKKRVSVKRRGGNDKKKNTSRNSRGSDQMKTKKRDGGELKTGSKKKTAGSSNGSKKNNNSSTNKKKTSSNNKKPAAKASKKDSKADKSKKSEMWYPKFDSILCTSGGGRPLVGFNPMYYATSKQACCVRSFPSMTAECMIRSSGSSAGGVSAISSGAKPGLWGGSTWMGGSQPSWEAGANQGSGMWMGDSQSSWAAANPGGGKSGKSGGGSGNMWSSGSASSWGGSSSWGGTSTTVVLIKTPGEKEVDTEQPTMMPTDLPTTYIPTYNPTGLPTELNVTTDTPTYNPSVGGEYLSFFVSSYGVVF
jgi:hypothetical protein